MKINKHIEIVSSTRLSLSSMGQVSRDGAKKVLERHYTKVVITMVDSLSDLEALVVRKPDLVFLGMKFVPANSDMKWQDSEKIWLSDYLDQHGIAYTGSSQAASALERDKYLAKQQVMDAGFRTSPFFVARQNATLKEADVAVEYPLFVKPTNRGGGLGIDSNSIVHTFEQLQSKVDSITSRYQADSLIEQYLSGREFSVAILRNEGTDTFATMPLELIAPADKDGVRILSGKIKEQDAERFVAVSDPAILSDISSLALGAFHALGARDYGRIDIRLDSNGDAHFLEANLLPSLMDGYGNFPKACWLNRRIDYETMILSIVSMAMPQADYELGSEPSALVTSYQAA